MSVLKSEINKFLVALVGVAGVIVSAGLVPPNDVKWVTEAITAATAALVYLVPNVKPTSNPPAPPA